MQITVKNKNELERTFRIDGEFYQEKFLVVEQKLLGLSNIFPISELCYVSDGNHMSMAKYFDLENGIPYYRGKDLTDFFLENVNPIFIPARIFNSPLMKRSHFKTGDVLISIVGTIGNLSLVTENIKYATGSCKIAILRPKSIQSEYLAVFLMSKYGNRQLKRSTRGAVQTGLILEDFDQIYALGASSKFQSLISTIVRESLTYNRASRDSYKQMEHEVLSELNLLSLQHEHKISFIASYSRTQNSVRMDAEYFQPKYGEIINAVKSYKYGWVFLGNSVNVKDQNFSPIKDKEFKYIELANIGANGEIIGYTTSLGSDLPSRARRKVSSKDLIVSSIEGSLSSIALIESDLDGALCSTGFYVINSDSINSETLLVYLKSIAGQLLLKKGCSGTILTAINKDEFSKIVIPKFDVDIQSKIKDKVTQVYSLRNKSKQLLEIAKYGVEIAIEKSEKTAQKWMDEQLN